MSIKPIISLPDPILRQVSQPLARVDDDVRKLAHDMLETMYAAPGIGLAAIQVAEPVRLLVLDVAGKEEPPSPLVVINPEVLWRSDVLGTYDEGCLSIPEYYAEVARPKQVRIAYLDLSGERQELEADGLLATCLQHEIDHINGILFIDHLSKLKRDMVIRKFKKIARDRKKEGITL